MAERLVLALLLSFSAIALADGGLLCVSGSACRTAELPSQVEPADRARTFVWKAADGRQLVYGIVGSGASEVRGTEGASVRLILTSAQRERPAAPAALRLHGGDKEWPEITLSAAEVRRQPLLRVEPGKYELGVTVARHRRAAREITVAAGRQDVRIVAEPLPLLTGRVIGAGTKEPIVGATIAVDELPEIVPVAADGRFEIDLEPERWPSALRVSAPGYGEARIAVPKARVSADLADIALAPGASVIVRITRPPEIGEVAVSLYERKLRQRKETPVATQRLAAGAETIRFEGLAGGDYALLVRGESDAEQWGEALTIADGETAQAAATIEPLPLVVRVRLRGEPLARARVTLRNVDGMWRGVLRADDDGVAAGTIWQRGEVSAIVEAPDALTSAHLERRTLAGDDEIDWTIDVPARSVSGRVVDAATGRGIANANIQLRVEGAQRIVVTRAADAGGAFELLPVPPGSHSLSAAADGYIAATKHYELAESEAIRVVELPLDRANQRRLVVRDSHGRPVAGAAVLDFAAGVLTGHRVTDAAGEVTIPIPQDGQRSVFIVPRDDAFAHAALSRGGTTTITTPAGVATLRIRVETTGHDPLPEVWLTMRVDGTPIPPEVQQALASMQGSVAVSGRDGTIVFRNMPAGLYEIWPLGVRPEAQAPLRIQARPGENAATLTFEPVR